MNKAIFAALAFLLFFSAGAVAVAECSDPLVSTLSGLEDCGVDKLDPVTGEEMPPHYISMQDFQDNGFPDSLNEGDKLNFRVYIRNTQGSALQDNFISTGLWQVVIENKLAVKSYPYSRNPEFLTLEAGETGHIDLSLEINGILKVKDAIPSKNKIVIAIYNGNGVMHSAALKEGFALEAAGQEIEIAGLNLPAYNCPPAAPTGVCRSIGDTIGVTYTIKNLSAAPLGPFNFAGSSFFRTPFRGYPLNEPCGFVEGNVAGEGADFLAANGESGDEKKVSCSHTISFREGVSSFYTQASVGAKGQVQAPGHYTVEGGAYHFQKIFPLSIYNNISGPLSIEYNIGREKDTQVAEIYFVAQVQDKLGDPWVKVGNWTYIWPFGGTLDQEIKEGLKQDLVDYDLRDVLTPGKKKLRVTIFDEDPGADLPDPPNSFTPNMLDWITTDFAVPRMVQLDGKPYFPGRELFELKPGKNTLGIRNLYDVSALNESLTYKISMTKGNPDNVTVSEITCDTRDSGMVCPLSWPDLSSPLEFTFSERLPDEDFVDEDGTGYGGVAPALNAEITLNINQKGTYEFRIEILNDVIGTDLDESNISEEFGSRMLAAAITNLTAESVDVGEDSTIHIEINEARTPTVKIFDQVSGAEEAGVVFNPSPSKATSQDILYTTPLEERYLKVVATIEQPCDICTKTAFFGTSKVRGISIPEVDLLAVALTALSVVAITAFAGRKK